MINNMPEEVKRYVVARNVNNELWFWGSYSSQDAALEVARDIDGVVFDTREE